MVYALAITLAYGGFTDQTAAAGLSAPHVPAYASTTTYAAGGAVGDFDRNGYPDIFVVSGGGLADQLFLNQGDGTFDEVGGLWGVNARHQGTGAVSADVNGDGWPDLFVTSLGGVRQQGPGHHRLYLNNHGVGFIDVASSWGVDSTGATDGWGGSFGDIDLDGDLDLFVPGYLTGANTLFRNDGDHFTDITAAMGLDLAGVAGFAARMVDMDHDLWPELILIGDFNTSRYYRNDHGQLIDTTGPTGLSLDGSEMGVEVADLDGDGLLDLYVTTIGTNNLHRNRGGHRYFNFGGAAGVDQAGWSWGTVALDVDHDTHLDLAVTSQTGRQFLFRNQGTTAMHFVEEAVAQGFDSAVSGRALSRLDYDRDGDMDLVVFPFGDEVTLFRNDLVSAPDAHWLTVTLDTRGHPHLAPDGIGAHITASVGHQTWLRSVDAGSSFLSNSEPMAHFGLGPHEQVDTLQVRWPDGSVSLYHDVATDQHLVLHPRGLLPQAAGPELLTVDGSTGGPERRVQVARGSTVSLALATGAHGPASAAFTVVARDGRPTPADLWTHPLLDQPLVVPPCRLYPTRPELFTLATSLPSDPCGPTVPLRAPLTLDLTVPNTSATWTLQGILHQGRGSGARTVATNAILLEVR